MKKNFIILVFALFAISVFAQSPNKMSYQAVIRNVENKLVVNQKVGMQISILRGSTNGSVVYQETLFPRTNANGLVSVAIGNSSIGEIDWSDDIYFIKTEIDPRGGNNYTIVSVSQMLSVPYAFHSKTADKLTGKMNETDPKFTNWDKSTGISIKKSQISDLGTIVEKETDPLFSAWDKNYNDLQNKPTNATSTKDGFMSSEDKQKLDNINGSETKIIAGENVTITGSGIASDPYVVKVNKKHYVGELYGGGIVFWVDHTGEHGLIASLKFLGTSKWSNVYTPLGLAETNFWDGRNNTKAIINQAGHTNSAAKMCDDYVNKEYGTGVYNDWYLPSSTELCYLFNNLYAIEIVLATDNNEETHTFNNAICWSSTQKLADNTQQAIAFGYNYMQVYYKSESKLVRAIRSF